MVIGLSESCPKSHKNQSFHFFENHSSLQVCQKWTKKYVFKVFWVFLLIYWFSGLSNSVISCFSKNENFAFTTRKRCSDCIFSPKNTQNWVLNGECLGVDSKNIKKNVFLNKLKLPLYLKRDCSIWMINNAVFCWI